MSKSSIVKILTLVALALVFVSTVSVMAFAQDNGETAAQSDSLVYKTAYGTFTVPEKYADVDSYPWVSFNAETGACLYASKVFAQNSTSILSHNNTGYGTPTIVVILRKDITVSESSQWHNSVWNAGRHFVIDLQGHNLTLAYGMGCLFSAEAKTGGHARYSFQNGYIVYKTKKPMLSATPRADKSGLIFEVDFERINFSIDSSVATSGFSLFCSTATAPGNDVEVRFNFIDSNLDISNIGSSLYLFNMGSTEDNVNTKVTFKGGNIKGNLTNLCLRYSNDYQPIYFEKNSEGNYPTVSLPTDSATPTRIFSSAEGLLSFNDTNKVVGTDGYTTYTPTLVTAENALPYGWLPEGEALFTVFNANTQAVIYHGDVFASSDANSALGITNGKSGMYIIYFHGDVSTSATTGTVWNLCTSSNTVVLEMNGHSLQLKNTLFRAQVKSTSAKQNLVVRNGIINNNGQSLVSTGATLGSDNKERKNAIVNFVFENVTFTVPHGYLVTDGVERDYVNNFNVYFKDCNFNVSKDYTHTLFKLGHFSTSSTKVFVLGGNISFGTSTIGSIYDLLGKTNVSVTFGKNDEGRYPTIKTAETNGSEEFAMPTDVGTLYYLNTTSANGVSTWNIYEKTEYGYIDEAHLDKTLYPMAVFLANQPMGTWYPISYGNEAAGTIVYEIYRSGATYNKVDCVLYVRSDVTFGGSVWHCSPQNNFTIDLGGNTVTMGCILFRFQTRTSGAANITVKNGTINANSQSIITHGFQVSKNTSVTFENVNLTNVHRLMGEEAGGSNRTANLQFDITFNNCNITQKAGAQFNLFNFTATDWWPTANIQINGGSINFTNGKYMLATNGNPEMIKINFGAYKGEYTDLIVKNSVDWSAFVEYDLNGLPLQMVKSADDGNNETYTLTPLSFVSTYLNLTNELNFVYRVFLPAPYTNPVATFTVGDDIVTVTEYTIDEKGLYCFKLTAVAPHKMGDLVNATVTATFNGTEGTILNNKVSIKNYADALRTQYAEDSAMLALLDNLLVYGAASQVYMNYNLDALVAEIGELAEIPEAPITMAGESSAIANIAACGLMLDGAFDLRVGIKATTLEGLTLEITKGDKTTTVELTADMMQGEYLTVYYDGLFISELDSEVTFTLKQNGETVGKTLTFSANAYLYRMQTSENTALSNLTKALYAYGAAAKAYNA